ncbi:peptidoglycan DD-metalloendopeptidase family protein [Staphylococcus saprophyticus]|uniref:tape measure protein n=1 Tax=Staphylococcus saprophyticus TaxID=29385 RepID=UPI001F28D19E|nr:tape measure protein [Staphylococcus saprophyticus]MCE5131181.1 peptidoglycan DD-metalloendopeptidase family protein [Staphylococcus saprophyticus]
MAERIKGLQIDLSMRDMGVSKTLSGIKREFRSLNSSLKLSSNNFKYGEKSASSYKTRMNDLDKSIKVGTSNLNELEKQYKQVAQSQGANSAKAVRLQTEYNKQANAINAMQDEYGRLNQYYRENFSMAGRLSNSFKSIGSSMQSVGGQAQNMGRSLTSSITKPALIAGTAMAGITAKLGFDRLVGLDSAKAKLEGLGYSTKEVGSITDQVSKAIEGGMTTMAEGTDVAAGALAAGVKEGKDLEKYIKLVGDAAVGSNRPVGEMAMIFNRVQGQGKLMTQELNMVEEGMPGFSNAMAKHLGVSYDAFREMVTNGEVSSKEFLTVMDDFAGGMANAYSKSWKGMMQNTKAYIGMIGESLLGGVFEQSKDSLHEFEKMLKSPGAQQWAKETGEKLGSAFSKLANGIKGIINWWQSLDGSTQKTLGGMVKWLGITLVTMGPVLTIFGKMASTIGGMFSGMSSLIQFFIRHNGAAKVSAASQAIWNGVTTTARGIANGYRAAMTALTTSQTIQAIKSRIAATAMTIWTGVTKAAALATRGLGLAIRFMTGPIGIVITVITALVGAIIYLWKTNSTFRNAVISIWNSIKAAAISIFGFIKPYIINIWNAIKNSTIAIWNAIKTSAVTIWNGIKFAVQHPIQALKNVLSALWNGMKTAAIKIWTLLKNGVLAIIRAYVAQVRSNFNLVKRIVITIFNAIKSFAIKVWNAIKNSVINLVKGLKNGIVNTFNSLKKSVTSIFNAIKNFSLKLWTNIKNGVVSRAKSLWNGVKNMFNNLKNSVDSITSKIRSFLYSVWTAIKNKIISLAKSLWIGVRDKFNALKKSAIDITQKLKNAVKDKWESLKKNVVDLATGAKDGVVKGFKAMYNKGVEWLDKLKGFIKNAKDGFKKVASDLGKGVANGAISGLNAMIDGINTLSDKIMKKKLIKNKIKPLSTGTGANPNVQTDSQGRLTKSTKAIVNDKGLGNASGSRGHKEIIHRRNGKIEQPKGNNKRVNLKRGDAVYNGIQSKSLMPHLSTGTGADLLKQAKKRKKHEEPHGDMFVPKNSGFGGGNIAEDALNWTKETAKKAKDSFGKAIGDVMDYMDNPGQLVGKVMKHFGVDFSSIKGAMGGTMSWAYGGLKKGLKDLITGWFEEQSGAGDGGYIDLSRGINFGFARTGAEAIAQGYPFARPHHGIDVNYPYGTKVYSTISGKATGTHGYNGGFGNNMTITSGIMKVIYGHLSKLNWTGTRQVKPGDLLGKSGGDPSRQGANAGDSTGPHLHYEMQWNGVAKDPLPWLKKNNGGGKAGGKYGSTIKQALGMAGLPQTSQYIKAWQEQARTESTFNPKARNPSGASGLVQVKPATFNAFKLPGHGNIWNPLDNLIAGMRYAKATYGPKKMLNQIGHGLPYATGGLINSSGLYQLAEEGHPEFVIPTDPSRQSDAMKLLAIARQRIESNKKNKRPNQMRTPSASNTNDNEMMNVMARQLEATQRQVELLTQLVASNQRLEQKPTGVSEQDMSKAQGKRAQMMAYNMGGAF